MTVVVGYTPNAYGQAALAAGIAEASLRGERLVVVNATKGDALVDQRFATQAQVQEVSDDLAHHDLDVDVRQSVGADIADQILAVVAETDASRLVIGVRHRTAVGKLLLGSVAAHLLMECPCPVLAVKPE